MISPSLHTLKKRAELDQLNPAYTTRLVAVTQALLSSQVPVVYSLMHLAHLTGTSWSGLRAVIRREKSYYRLFIIKKRSGGDRRICSPSPMLKSVQSWIHNEILKSPGALKRIHRASAAYSPGSAILKNANIHAGCSWLIKVDIKDFFESISERQVYHVFRSFNYPRLLSMEFARICTRVRDDGNYGQREKMWRWTNANQNNELPYPTTRQIGHLPQGAPTSAMLANLVVISLDEEIQKIADSCGALYSRYADDIVLSLNAGTRAGCNEIIRSVAVAVTNAGFRVNRVKSHVSGPGSRKVVTGLIVNDIVPRLNKSTRDEIELAIYHIGKHGLLSHVEHRHSKNPLGYLNHLIGLIYFARSIDRNFGDKALLELKAALKPYSDLLQMFKTLIDPTTHNYYQIV